MCLHLLKVVYQKTCNLLNFLTKQQHKQPDQNKKAEYSKYIKRLIKWLH